MERVYLFPGEYEPPIGRPLVMGLPQPILVLDFDDLYPLAMKEAIKAQIPRSTKPDKKIDQD